MFTPRIRWLLAAGSFGFGCYRVSAGDYAGFALIAAALLLVYGHFKYNTVWLAFRAVSAGQLDKAAALLQLVKRPASLGSEARAYFELASGLVCASRAQNDDAEKHLRVALTNRLRTDNDRALAEAVLAQLLIVRDELPEARTLLDQAAARPCRPATAERIRTLRDDLPALD